MSTAVATVPLTQEQFQEAMMARMRGIMGELMPQATLEEITKRGVEEAFFKPRKETEGSGYHAREVTKGPWINDFLQKELAAEVNKQLAAWIAANNDRVLEAVSNTLAAGVTGCVTQYFVTAFHGPLGKLVHEINERFSKLGQNQIY